MSRHAILTGCMVLAVGLAGVGPARAGRVPRTLRGKIIVSDKSIDIPARNLVRGLKRQDRRVIERDGGNQWTLHLVAFFRHPLPADRMGVVVLDAKQGAVAVAQVGGKTGQSTLACPILVDSTESPGEEHTVQVYYVEDGKPVVLAEKKIVLK